MNICLFDDFIIQKKVINTNINISIDNSNVYINKNIEPILVGTGINTFSNYNTVLNYKNILVSNIAISSNNSQVFFSSSTSGISGDSYTNINTVYVNTDILTLKSINSGSFINVYTNTDINIENSSPSYNYSLVGYNGINILGGYPNITIAAGSTSINTGSQYFTIYINTTVPKLPNIAAFSIFEPGVYTIHTNSTNFTIVSVAELRYIGPTTRFLTESHFTHRAPCYPVVKNSGIEDGFILYDISFSKYLCSSSWRTTDLKSTHRFYLTEPLGNPDIERFCMSIIELGN